MHNIVLTTRLTAFGCLSLMLAGYSVWINDNIHKKFSLKDILLNTNFKTDPFVDYHDYFPTEEDIANHIVNDNFLDEIAHHDAPQEMMEMADHYEELFEAPDFVTISPEPPVITVSYRPEGTMPIAPPKAVKQIEPKELFPLDSQEGVILSLKPRDNIPSIKKQVEKQHTEQISLSEVKPANIPITKKENMKATHIVEPQKIILPIERAIEQAPAKPSQLSTIEQAIKDLSRHHDKSDPFFTAAPHRQKIKSVKKEKIPVKTNYLSLYKPQTDLDDSFILPIADALYVSKANQTEKRDNFKKDIANIYDKRRVQTLKARDHNKAITNHITEMNKILKQMDISLEKKFYAHKHDLSKHSILSDMQASKEDLVFRFPNLHSSLQKAQALKIALSFVPTASPVRTGRMSSNYGWRKDPFKKTSRFHSGIDFAAPTGTPIYSPASGTVKFAGRKGGYGNMIEIYHGNGITTRYAHLSRINVKKGQKIMQFSKIGAVGSTGRSTGPHLHYEIMKGNKKVNPKIFTNKNKKIVSIIKKLK